MKADGRELALDNRRISIRLEQLTDEQVAKMELSAAQAHILIFILHHAGAGTSLTAIHHAFGYSMASLSSILKRLRKNGYVRVEPCPEDDRRKLLFGTEKAAQMERFLACAICDTCNRAYQGFSESELLELNRLQKKILQNLFAYKQHASETKGSVYCEKSSAPTETV